MMNKKQRRNRNRMKPSLVFSRVILLLALSLIIGACTGSTGVTQEQLTLAPESALPDFVRDAPPQVQEAYRFAIANPDVLTSVPCYCGCGAMGHQNNLQCYIKESQASGSIEFEKHAFG
jgi:hypothetical protein